MNLKRYYSTREVADELGLSDPQLVRDRNKRRNVGKHKQRGGRWRFTRADIDKIKKLIK